MKRILASITAIGAAFWTYELWKAQSMTDQDKNEKAVDILARTIWGEARDQGQAGMQAVAAVAVNRVKFAIARGGRYWWGNDIVSVCLRPWQFSCWNANDPNRTKLEMVDGSDRHFAVALEIAAKAIQGTLGDPTNGATHYHNPSIVGLPSDWGEQPQQVASLGDHDFYNGIA